MMIQYETLIPEGSAFYKLQKVSNYKSFCIPEHKVENLIQDSRKF